MITLWRQRPRLGDTRLFSLLLMSSHLMSPQGSTRKPQAPELMPAGPAPFRPSHEDHR